MDATRPERCVQLLISAQLDGAIDEVGSKFWEAVTGAASWVGQKLEEQAISEIRYVDRYIRTPLHARILREILYSAILPSSGPTALVIQTVGASSGFRGRNVHQNWQNDRDQSGVIQHLFANDFVLNLQVRQHNSGLRHARFLTLTWDDGSVVDINIDQGMGFLRTENHTRHDFDQSPAVQAQQVEAAQFSVRHGGANMPVYIVRQ